MQSKNENSFYLASILLLSRKAVALGALAQIEPHALLLFSR